MDSVLGERVLLCRRDMGLNQTELGRRSGVSRAHISRIENGQARGVTTSVLLALARALQTDAGYLLGTSDNALTGDDGDEDDHMAENAVTYEAESPDDRRFIESLLAVVRDLSRENQLFLLMMAEKLRKR